MDCCTKAYFSGKQYEACIVLGLLDVHTSRQELYNLPSHTLCVRFVGVYKRNVLKKILSQIHYVHHISNTYWPGIKPDAPG